MVKELPAHQDKLGQDLAVDDCVTFPSHNSLVIGKVVKLNNKMVKVKSVKNTMAWNKYPDDLIKLDSSVVTLYLLRNT